MALGLMYRFREPLTVIAVAAAAVISLAAANAAYLRHVSSHPGYSDSVLVLASKPVILLASLNKVLLPMALHLLNNGAIEDWARGAMMLGALFGIGIGTLVGAYLLLWFFGMAVTRGGDAFGWGALRAFKRVSITACAVYLLFGVWHLIQYRQSFDAGILGDSVGSAAGFFALTTVGFMVLGLVGYYIYSAVRDGRRARDTKRW